MIGTFGGLSSWVVSTGFHVLKANCKRRTDPDDSSSRSHQMFVCSALPRHRPSQPLVHEFVAVLQNDEPRLPRQNS